MAGLLKKQDVVAANKAKLKKARSLAETKNWYKDKYQTVIIQRNMLLICTLMSLIGVAVLGAGLAALSDSKIFEPFVVEVDNKTGIVTHVESKSIENLSADDAVRRALLVQYVMARESYNYYTYYKDYHRFVRLLSSSSAYRDFRFAISPSNEDSPLNLKELASRSVRIISITFLEKDVAQIRISVAQRNLKKGQVVSDRNYISTIKFRFDSGKVLSQQDSYINPLGFEVLGYTRELEYVK